MAAKDQRRIKELIERLGRIVAAEEWTGDLNPTQWTALSYLAQANRFSRAPSQVADYMSATRGTVSQTLKAMARKGLVSDTSSEKDKRSISYTVTSAGRSLLDRTTGLDGVIASLERERASDLHHGLETLVRNTLRQRGLRPFGICKTCGHFEKKSGGGYCALLGESLTPGETDQICHEHVEAA